MREDMVQAITESFAAPIGHPATKREAKGDPRIVAELEHARFRNRNDDNPNMRKSRMFFDFDAGRVVWGDEA